MFSSLVAIGASSTVYFYVYSIFTYIARRRISTALTLPVDMLLAFIAGVINATVTCPLWTVVTRRKLAKANTTGSLPAELLKVLQSGDAFKGLGASILLCTNPAIQFGMYEQIRRNVLRAGEVSISPLRGFFVYRPPGAF